MAEPGSWRDTLGGILFFFLWPLYVPYLLLKWLLKLIVLRPLQALGLDGPVRTGYVRTVGWLKMKLGLWQPIGYFPAWSKTKYDYVPDWVKKAAGKELERGVGKQTIELNGRSFKYRVKYHVHGRKGPMEKRYYRKLRTPLRRRTLAKLNPFD